MEFSTFVFVLFLVMPGLLLVGKVRRYLFEMSHAGEERKRAVVRPAARPRMVVPASLRVTSAIAPRQADPWESLTTSLISEAFEKFSNER